MKIISSLILATALASLALPARAQVPGLLNYQGKVAIGATPFTGTGRFKFALVDATGTVTYWSNDGTSNAGSEPTAAVSRTIAKGVYSLLLGDTTLANMTTSVPASVFANGDVRLRVWFDDGTNGSELLTPDQRIASVGYAMTAGSAETVTDGAITAAKIAPGAVGNAQLGPNLVLSGTTIGVFNGSFTGNATSAEGFTGALAGDVTGPQGATLVSAVGTSGAAEIHAAELRANAATSANAANTIVFRDASGNFATGSISLSSGLSLPATTSDTVGVITQNGAPLLHSFGAMNFFAGSDAGNFSMTGSANTANGSAALSANTTGNQNTASGTDALSRNTTGSINTANGARALYLNTVGDANTASGSGTLFANTTGSDNTASGANSLARNTTGGGNAAHGSNALVNNTTGTGNTASGAFALGTNTTGTFNIAIGYAAGGSLTVGNNNIVIGNEGVAEDNGIIRIGTAQTDTFLAGVIHGDGSGLTGVSMAASALTGPIVGSQLGEGAVTSSKLDSNLALSGNFTAASVNAAGTISAASINAFGGITTGSLTTFGNLASFGPFTAYGNIDATGNLNLSATAQGGSAGVITQDNTTLIHSFAGTGGRNFFAGLGAGNFSFIGSGNTASGDRALASLAGSTNEPVRDNTAMGASALQENTTGIANTASGSGALKANTIGSSNTASGVGALYLNTTGSTNTAGGSGALQFNTTGNGNVASGVTALYSNVDGSANTALGVEALYSNVSGNSNIAIGFHAGYQLTGTNNIAIGHEGQPGDEGIIRIGTAQSDTYLSGIIHGYALDLMGSGGISQQGSPLIQTRGYMSFFAGTDAGGFNDMHSFRNTGIGASTLRMNRWGDSNTAIGANALYSNEMGFNNVASGVDALNGNMYGNDNTAVGSRALTGNYGGSGNIALGSYAGELLSGNDNIAIGNQGNEADNATIRIGKNGLHTRSFVAGIVGVTTEVNDAVQVVIDSNGQLGTISSSRRYKEDIADMGDTSARLHALRPVTFHYKKPYANGTKPVQYGLIAEEVAATFPELAVLNANGQPETVKYQNLTPLLLNEVQKLRTEKDELQQESTVLRTRLEKLEAAFAEFTK